MRHTRYTRRRWRRDLETLINQHLDILTGPDEDRKKNIKLPEVIKLIELHTKLSDEDTGTKEFWNMIEQIRRKNPPITSRKKKRRPEPPKENAAK